MRVRVVLRDYLAGRSAFVASVLHLLSAVPQALAAVRREVLKATRIEQPALDPEQFSFRLPSALVGEMKRTTREIGADFFLIGPEPEWRKGLNEDRGLVDLGAWELYKERVSKGEPTTVPFDPHQNELGHRLFGVALVDRLLEQGAIGSR